ncbi:hypothetical protein TRFO_27126 [Tritrichomonas foetus]|uniref:HEAT repeat family protein n=1 Tax=Tritrichomonas foetus TaxID=1144522 RepID=A0A1J4K2Z6_9EUKA|nr:hypothetical protein TRFO_27126 [Tritrichomonas foetus]|eukprot:OHT05192.1 hypothetical protein TRFO_27126 [Tritrichomonas foetus]
MTKEEKKAALLKHTNFTEHLGALLSDAKREVREMSSQCIGHLALAIGPSIIDPEFKIHDAIFNPAKTAFALEGQQMALGRLATSFRIESPESLKLLLPKIIDNEQFSTITNPSDNGYVFWYSTRALLLFVNTKYDATLQKYVKQIEESYEFVIRNFKDQIISCAYDRLSHKYANVRRTAALVVSSVFSSIENDREKFIDSLLPKGNLEWVALEGLFAAIGGCLTICKKPLESEYIDSLCQKLSAFVKDPISWDTKTPITQKGNANGMAGKALVQVLRVHDRSLYEKYVLPIVQYLLDAPVAAHIDAGVLCLSELKAIGGFELKDLYLRAFKNICHASFPIRDLARRTIPAKQLVDESFNELITTLVKYGSNVDSEVKESVCKALQMVSGMTTSKFPDHVLELAEQLTSDNNESVAAAALDVLRCALDEQNVSKIPELVKTILSGDSDDAIVAAIRLFKSALVLFRSAVIGDAYELCPLLAFHTLASMTPSVSTSAQQLLVLIAGDSQEADDDLVHEISEVDFDSSDVSDLEELVEKCAGNSKAAVSVLNVIVKKYCENLGGETSCEVIEDLQNGDKSDVSKLVEYVYGEEKTELIAKLAKLLTKAADLSSDDVKKVLQVLADVFADEAIEIEDKQPLLLALDIMRKIPSLSKDKILPIPDPTPISLSHHTETFAKTQSI